MADVNRLEVLQALHRELVAVSEHRYEGLADLDAALQDHATQFRQMVDKPPRKAESRKAVESGTITIGDETYRINKDFQECALQLADELDLDEVVTAALLLDAEDDTATLGRPLLECGLIRFHQQRKYLLDCMRLCIQLADDPDLDTELQAVLADYVAEHIYGVPRPGMPAVARAARIVPRCMAVMQGLRLWLHKLGDRATAAAVLQAAQPPEVREMFDFARASLVQQHEGVAMVLYGAVSKQHVEPADFTDLLAVLQKWDRYDTLLVHHIPILSLYIRLFGSPDGLSDLAQARRLNDVVSRRPDDEAWALPSLRAALCAWWIAEYSSWYMDDLDVPLDHIDVDKEDAERAEAFSDCLKEGALDFLLAVASDVAIRDWRDPTPSGVQLWIQRKCPPLPADAVPFSDFFCAGMLEQVENFVDAFISNLPDILRQLRVDEDEQRQLSQAHEQSLELERFLLIIAHAYERRPDAAEAFWADPESSLAGFMQWASHRASTPLVSAFCEMLRAISSNEASADAAHQFLLDDTAGGGSGSASTSGGGTGGSGSGSGSVVTSSGRMRKSQALTWMQVIKELEFFTSRIRAHTNPAPALNHRHVAKPGDDQEEAEPESAIMLQCYLRLIARMCANSRAARAWLLQSRDFSLVGILFQLASLPIPSSLRACVFAALEALLTDKTLQISYIMWNCLDDYMAGTYRSPDTAAIAATIAVSSASSSAAAASAAAAHHHASFVPNPVDFMKGLLDEIGWGFDQPYAFVQFLLALVRPAVDQSPLNDVLPFPEGLGNATRLPGIEPYVDFVLDLVLGRLGRLGQGGRSSAKQQQYQQYQQPPLPASTMQQPTTDAQQQQQEQQHTLRLGALDFALTCLDTFNEDLILLANETAIPVDHVIKTSDLAAYARLHPFARVMEWMYNHNVVEAIFGAIHEDPAALGRAAPDSPLILGLVRAVELVSKILDLQDTYQDLVRQVVRLAVGDRRKPVAAAYGAFEEAIANHLDLVVDLGHCCGLGHPTLTLACLRLLEQISVSPRVMAAWNPEPGRGTHAAAHRNKAIVALERDDEAGMMAGVFVAEMMAPLDLGLEADAPNFRIKTYMLNFLYACLQASPERPTIAHLLLGFTCGAGDQLGVEPGGAFDRRTSLFHNLLRVLLEAPFGDDRLGMRRWLVLLKHKVLRVLQVLWRATLSARLVLADLRENDFAFHLLLRDVVPTPALPWDGLSARAPAFATSDAAHGLLAFWALRAMTLEYVGIELCSVAQNRLPSLKRRLFDALSGRVVDDAGAPVDIPTVFDLCDVLASAAGAAHWDLEPPVFHRLRDVDLGAAAVAVPASDELSMSSGGGVGGVAGSAGGGDSPFYDLDRAREVVLLKSAEIVKAASRPAIPILATNDAAAAALDELREELAVEEALLLEYLAFLNRQKQMAGHLQGVLQAWTKLLLVMFEANEFAGAARVSFLLQTLQAILPGLEAASTDNPEQALQLAKLAEVLLFKLYASKEGGGGGGGGGDVGDEDGQMSSLVSDKLFQLFQICLYATCKWGGSPELRAVYYNICYRYVAGLLDRTGDGDGDGTGTGTSTGAGTATRTASSGWWHKANRAVSACGERVLNVVCDDAYASDAAACQTAALVLLGALVRLGAHDHDGHVVATLHRLNFIGVLVDSLKTALEDGLAVLPGGAAVSRAVVPAVPGLSALSPGPVVAAVAAAAVATVADRRRAQEAKLALLLQLCQTRDGAKHTLHANLFRAIELSSLFAADPELQVDPTNTTALAQHYGLLVQVARILGAAVVSRGSHNVVQGRRFLAAHRMLVMHVLKRSAGIGPPVASRALNDQIADLADAFMVLIVATDFVEFEDEQVPAQPQKNPAHVLFH